MVSGTWDSLTSIVLDRVAKPDTLQERDDDDHQGVEERGRENLKL